MSGNIPNLEEQFLEPTSWQWQYFERGGRKIRFGSVFPEDTPTAIIICLPGLSEFCEKYFETAQNMLERNYAFVVFDWVGQGKSSRYLSNPHKRHSNGFQHDINDMHELVSYIQRANTQNVPLIMLAHSMGGNIGAHYLHQRPDIFTCAAFSAPMFGLKALNNIPAFLRPLITGMIKIFAGHYYIKGGTDWNEDMRPALEDNLFSSDMKRNALHNQWCIADKSLQVGSITYGWLYYAVKSCAKIPFKAIQTHCLIASAEKEVIVDNNAINRAVKLLPNARHIVLPDARHEILMENDKIRDGFFEAFYKLIEETTTD